MSLPGIGFRLPTLQAVTALNELFQGLRKESEIIEHKIVEIVHTT